MRVAELGRMKLYVRGLDALEMDRHREISLADGPGERNTPMNSILAMSAIALAIVIFISIAITLTMEGAGALYMRNQIRTLLKLSRAAISAQQPTQVEDAQVIVLR